MGKENYYFFCLFFFFSSTETLQSFYVLFIWNKSGLKEFHRPRFQFTFVSAVQCWNSQREYRTHTHTHTHTHTLLQNVNTPSLQGSGVTWVKLAVPLGEVPETVVGTSS